MRSSMKMWLAMGTLALSSSVVSAQKGSVAVGAGFDYGRANLVQGCNCFNLFGGGAVGQFGLTSHVALLADVTVARQSGLTPDGYALTESTYMGGVRAITPKVAPRLRLFGDVLVGVAHAGGSLSPAKTGYGSANAFAAQMGGGLQISFGRRWVVVPAQADYLLTTFSNGGTNLQNQLRVQAGILYRIRK